MSLQNDRERSCTNGLRRIKKAYRKKALELHPDRNYGNVEETTRLFADVQSAYSVLSDPQERAWYDSHRNAFSQNEHEPSEKYYEHNVRMTTTEDVLKVFARFNGRMGFSDSASDFYSITRSTFDTLAKEEELACEWEGLDPVYYPSFGHAGGDYEASVRPFYAAWSNFATSKTFSWEDIYRYSEAPDRRIRRMMKKKNQRCRDDAIHKFNDSVRSLVAFVKKRDPRFKPNTQSEMARQKILRDTAMAQAARSRAANQIKSSQPNVIPKWTRVEELSEDDAADEKQQLVETQLECIICKKTFKSENQYAAHEKSKKHIKAIQQIRRKMRDDDKTLKLDETLSDVLSQSSGGDAVGTVDQRNIIENNQPVSADFQPLTNPIRLELSSSRSAYSLEHGINESTSFDDGVDRTPGTSSFSEFSEDDHAIRPSVKEPVTTEVDIPFRGCRTMVDADETTQKKGANSLAQDTYNSKHPKVGKAKQKRMRKTGQQAVANAKSDTNVSG